MKTKSILFAAALSLIPALSQAQVVVSIPNASSTGTTLNGLAKLTGAPSTAVGTATTDTAGIVGIVVSGAGTTGNALIARSGQATCNFDGATTAGDWVQNSPNTATDCVDTGSATFPKSGQIIGRVLSTISSAGTAAVNLAGPDVTGIPGNGTGSGVTVSGQLSLVYLACTPAFSAVSTGTTETVLVACEIPGGLMSANSSVRFSALATRSATANTDVFKWRIGTAATVAASTQCDTSTNGNLVGDLTVSGTIYFTNEGSATVNTCWHEQSLLQNNGTNLPQFALNTASPVYLLLTGTPGVTADVLTGVFATAVYLPSAGGN
jgi:hypothetical protein